MEYGAYLKEQPLAKEKLKELQQEINIVYKCGPSLLHAADATDSNEDCVSATTTFNKVYNKLRDLLEGQQDPGCSKPWKILKDNLPRQPIVFLAGATASTGDTYPFFRVIIDLAKYFPGIYHILLGNYERGEFEKVIKHEFNEIPNWLKRVHVHDCRNDWLSLLDDAPEVDAVITNSDVCWAERKIWEDANLWARMYKLMLKKNAPWIDVEFQWWAGGLRDQEDEWVQKLASWKASMHDYEAWAANLTLDEQAAARWQLRSLPHLLLECYPAELLTQTELHQASGILCGYVKPLLRFDEDIGDIKCFIDKIHHTGKKIVMLSRGGCAADRLGSPYDDQDVKALVDALLRLESVAVIVMGSRDSQVKQTRQGVLVIPNLKFDFSSIFPIFPEVDIVIHHAVREILSSYWDMKNRCVEWHEKPQLTSANVGLSPAIEGLRRLIAGVMLQKKSGQWLGWTKTAISKDKKRLGSYSLQALNEHDEHELLRKTGSKLMGEEKASAEADQGRQVVAVDKWLETLPSDLRKALSGTDFGKNLEKIAAHNKKANGAWEERKQKEEA